MPLSRATQGGQSKLAPGQRPRREGDSDLDRPPLPASEAEFRASWRSDRAQSLRMGRDRQQTRSGTDREQTVSRPREFRASRRSPPGPLPSVIIRGSVRSRCTRPGLAPAAGGVVEPCTRPRGVASAPCRESKWSELHCTRPRGVAERRLWRLWREARKRVGRLRSRSWWKSWENI